MSGQLKWLSCHASVQSHMVSSKTFTSALPSCLTICKNSNLSIATALSTCYDKREGGPRVDPEVCCYSSRGIGNNQYLSIETTQAWCIEHLLVLRVQNFHSTNVTVHSRKLGLVQKHMISFLFKKPGGGGVGDLNQIKQSHVAGFFFVCPLACRTENFPYRVIAMPEITL